MIRKLKFINIRKIETYLIHPIMPRSPAETPPIIPGAPPSPYDWCLGRSMTVCAFIFHL
jgi:hypothetical protein